MTPTPDQVTRAIITACREVGGADMTTERLTLMAIAVAQGVGTGRNAKMADGVLDICRARAYAGHALDRVFNGGTKLAGQRYLAGCVGVPDSHDARRSFWGNLAGKVASTWWSRAAAERVVDATRAAPARYILKAEREAEPQPEVEAVPAKEAIRHDQDPSPGPKPFRTRPAARQEPQRSAAPVPAPKAPPAPERASTGLPQPRSGLDRFSARFGPGSRSVGGEDQLSRRAGERQRSMDLLREAAANTKALQDRMKESGE